MSIIPDDIKAELLLDYLPEGSFRVAIKGMHKRNACRDIVEFAPGLEGRTDIGLARKSFYDALPEYMFHPFDRFSNLDRGDMKESFREENEKQEREIEQAVSLFAPVDLSLLRLRKEIWHRMSEVASRNTVLERILADELSEAQRKNRFIQRTIPFLPDARYIRGDRTCINWMIRKIFNDENMTVSPTDTDMLLEDSEPRYECMMGGGLGSVHAGNRYMEQVHCYIIRFWQDEFCNEFFLDFIDEVEMFRLFLRDYFLSVEHDIVFKILDTDSPTRLSVPHAPVYLGYNTNIH